MEAGVDDGDAGAEVVLEGSATSKVGEHEYVTWSSPMRSGLGDSSLKVAAEGAEEPEPENSFITKGLEGDGLEEGDEQETPDEEDEFIDVAAALIMLPPLLAMVERRASVRRMI